MHDDKIKIFSSHRWSYDNHRQGLHDLLRPWAKNVDYIDVSIPKAHPVDVEDDMELAGEIRDRIRDCDVFLVFAGMYANGSEWVKFEIHSAFSDCCPILTVVPNGQERLSRTTTKFATRQVRWRGDSIRSAIWELMPTPRKEEILLARRARGTGLDILATATPINHLSGALRAKPPPTEYENYLANRPLSPPRLGSLFDPSGSLRKK